MDPQRTPKGETDLGDDAYGDSVIEAARLVLDNCVKHTLEPGLVRRFSEFHVTNVRTIRRVSKSLAKCCTR